MVSLVLSVMDAASEEGVKQATFHFSLYTAALEKPYHVDMLLIIVQCHGMSLSQSELLFTHPPVLKDLTLYSEFLLCVEYVMGKGGANTLIGGI